jgi:hypothetical protein
MAGLAQFNEIAPYGTNVVLSNASGTSEVTLVSSNVARLRIDAIVCTNTDTVAHVLDIKLQYVASHVIGSVTIPAGAGYGAVPSIEVVQALNLPNVPGFILPATCFINVQLEVTLTSGKVVELCAIGGYV